MGAFEKIDATHADAARVLSRGFVASFALLVCAGLLALSTVPQDDLANVPANATCLRLARRADFIIVFAHVGGSSLRLLLEFRVGVLEIFSERMHRSMSMHCDAHDPPRPFSEACADNVLVFRGKLNDRARAVVNFDYVNDHVVLAHNDHAAMLGLDGTIRLRAGASHFITSTHFCTSALEPDAGGLEMDLVDGDMTTTREALAEFKSELAEERCNSSRITVFPPEAANERVTWLSLSTSYVYDYADHVLGLRRRVLEIGQACAEATPELRHVAGMYAMDCAVVDPEWCRVAPALPLRRLAAFKLRVDVRADGATARLQADEAHALTRLPLLLPRSESLWLATGRLAIMIFTALAMFVRGSQQTSTTKYALSNAFDRVHQRRSRHVPETLSEVRVDQFITFVAFGVRVAVCASKRSVLRDDGLGFAFWLDLVGICSSCTHIFLRYYLLICDLSRESPLTKLAGPMSVVDCCVAVLVSFSEAPILSVDSGRFAAIGRLLISLLTSVAVFVRCIFGVSVCLLLAHTCVQAPRYEEDCYGYQSVLRVAAFCWLIQGAVSSALVAALFANPAAWSLSRALDSNVSSLPYAVFLGVLCVSLPAMNQNSVRVFIKKKQRE